MVLGGFISWFLLWLSYLDTHVDLGLENQVLQKLSLCDLLSPRRRLDGLHTCVARRLVLLVMNPVAEDLAVVRGHIPGHLDGGLVDCGSTDVPRVGVCFGETCQEDGSIL